MSKIKEQKVTCIEKDQIAIQDFKEKVLSNPTNEIKLEFFVQGNTSCIAREEFQFHVTQSGYTFCTYRSNITTLFDVQ